MLKKYKVIQDSREKKPWIFSGDWIEDVLVQKLDYGDYSLFGWEETICIERKRNTAEIANNMVGDRFKKVLAGMQQFRYKFLICEFSFSDVMSYPFGSGLPKKIMKRTRISSGWMLSFMTDISTKYDINVIYAGNAKQAQIYASSIMRHIVNG